VIGLLVVAGIAAFGISALAGDDETVSTGADAATQTAFAEAIGDPLPRLEPGIDAAIGTAAPTISAQNLDGDRVTIAADGTARLLGFFAHWCPHCQEELPATSAWLAANPLPAGVEVIAVSTAVDESAPNYPPSDWFEREAWPAPVLLDSPGGDIASGFGLSAFPYWVAVDADGTVIARMTGQLNDTQLDTLVAELAAR